MSEFNPETAKAIALAISDPGATTPRMPGENVTSWSTRAVHRILARLIAEAEREERERVAARVEAVGSFDAFLTVAPMVRVRVMHQHDVRAALKDGTP